MAHRQAILNAAGRRASGRDVRALREVGVPVRQRRLLRRLAQPGRRRGARHPARCPTFRCWRSAAASTCARRPRAPRPSSRASRRASCSSSRASATARSRRLLRLRARAVRTWMLGGTVAGTCPRSAPLSCRARRSRRPALPKTAKPLGRSPRTRSPEQAIADAEAMSWRHRRTRRCPGSSAASSLPARASSRSRATPSPGRDRERK